MVFLLDTSLNELRNKAIGTFHGIHTLTHFQKNTFQLSNVHLSLIHTWDRSAVDVAPTFNAIL